MAKFISRKLITGQFLTDDALAELQKNPHVTASRQRPEITITRNLITGKVLSDDAVITLQTAFENKGYLVNVF